MSNFVLVIANGIELKLLPFTCSPYNSEVACCTAVWEITLKPVLYAYYTKFTACGPRQWKFHICNWQRESILYKIQYFAYNACWLSMQSWFMDLKGTVSM